MCKANVWAEGRGDSELTHYHHYRKQVINKLLTLLPFQMSGLSL